MNGKRVFNVRFFFLPRRILTGHRKAIVVGSVEKRGKRVFHMTAQKILVNLRPHTRLVKVMDILLLSVDI